MWRFRGIFLVILVTSNLWSQRIIDPQILAQQEEAQKRATETGYGDIELDVLHREITEQLKVLATYPEKGEILRQNASSEEANLVLPIAFGESIKSISERYRYNGTCHIWFDGEKINKIMLRFTRNNLLGIEFLEEQRDIINPTPYFKAEVTSSKEIPELDRNDDMILVYWERRDQKKPFEKVKEFTLPQIRYFEKRVGLLEAYKKYLRRTKKYLERKIYDLDLAQRVQVQYLLEMK